VIAGFLAWTVAGLALTAGLVYGVYRRCRTPGAPRGFTIADWITASRLALIAPTLWLLASGRYRAAAISYIILGLTDVVDGVIARRRRETSAFGVFLDPLADILSTFSVFTVLVIDGLVPRWLYALLTFRYLMLAVGAVWLSRRFGRIELHATIPGKIVGVVQAAGVLWVLYAASAGREPGASDGPLFAFLGLGFVAIVVSQAVIGYRHIRRASTRAKGWQRGSSR
jgi:cardiolipin synthase